MSTNTDASRYVLPRGRYEGLTLAEVHASGAKGIAWLRWALRQVKEPPEFVAAVEAFIRKHEPQLLEHATAAGETTPTSVPRAKVKTSREAHRCEIQRRWDERRAVDFFVHNYAKNSRLIIVVGQLIYFSKWASPSKLLDSIDLSPAGRALMLDTLVRVIVLKEMPYDEYLQTDEWKARAATAKDRYDGRCALDASHAADHAHHRTYVRRGREYDSDIIPLCSDCHAKFHNRRA